MATIEAVITLVPPEHGGGAEGISPGYRPQFFFAGEDFVCQVEMIAAAAQPGETASAVIRLGDIGQVVLRGKLFPGCIFQLREGTRVVAGGVITRLLEPESRGENA